MLEDVGYSVIRSAGSKGPSDLAAFDGQRFRLIQVKTGGSPVSKQEREVFEQLVVPENCTKEVWRFLPRVREPIIEVV